MNKIKGEELRDFLDSESKKIAILDNNSANFFYTISNKANVDELLKKYDLILIPNWVFVEIKDSNLRLNYLRGINGKNNKIRVIDEEEYEVFAKYKSKWLYKFYLNTCFLNARLKTYLKKNVEKEDLDDLDDYEFWMKGFYDNAFEKKILNNGREKRKNAGEISICILALIIAYIYRNFKHTVTIISEDRDAYEYLKKAKEEIIKDNVIDLEEKSTITFKSNDFIIKEIYSNNLILNNSSIEEIIKVRSIRRVRYIVEALDGSIEEHCKLLNNEMFYSLIKNEIINIIF